MLRVMVFCRCDESVFNCLITVFQNAQMDVCFIVRSNCYFDKTKFKKDIYYYRRSV